MFPDFFQTQPLPAEYYVGHYDIGLVLLSYIVAVFASYIALDLTARLRDPNNTRISTLLWLVGGAIAMGLGIWSIHFIGMLSFSIPALTLRYDLYWTLLSLFVSIIASGFALYLLKQSVINIVHLMAGGIILGLAIASMHYTGMAGMLITLNIRYLPSLFFLSILIAILASEAAILLALKSNTVVLKFRSRIKMISAIIMGLAICGMHYTGMGASIFTALCEAASIKAKALDPTILAITVAVVTFIILGMAFFASSYKENINQQQFERARRLGMEEISASVLHNVGNVLNSANVSVGIISEKNSASPLKELKKLCELLNEHKSDLGKFVTQNPKGIYTLDFLNKLANYWAKEQILIQEEISALTKNIQMIKEIISTHQNLNKRMGIEEIVSIEGLLDEALLITGFDTKKGIKVEKTYGKMSPIVLDKVKIMQVFVNLLCNARDALEGSTNQDKILQVKTTLMNNSQIVIEISDNGVGISSANIKKIFHHGFTTKKLGHGFGLHASALSVNELGGQIYVESEGLQKGSSFFMKIPYRKPKV